MKLPVLLLRTTACTLLGSTLLLTGCASIVNGSKQKVKISSTPGGAAVRIDGASTGVTPTVADLSRKPVIASSSP
jgi:uncharacterized protein YceK